MHLRRMHILLFAGITHTDIAIWFNVSFKADTVLLNFSLDDLSIAVSGVFRSPNIIVFLSVSLFWSVITVLCVLVLPGWARVC